MITLGDLNEISRQVFDDNSLNITRETTANDIEDWDSLTHMNLVVTIEKLLKIKFALGELQSLENVGQMFDMISVKLAR
ncbi:MAG TPA: acyl carrier protein [Geobacteraceae bacterium]|nr:acyl carrier protein [Geobacteraceae bacterium]